MMTKSGFWVSGWSFPPRFESANNQLNLVHKESNINQSIYIILNTRRGERSLSPSFGSDLSSYLFSKMDSTLKGEIVHWISSQNWHDWCPNRGSTSRASTACSPQIVNTEF